MENLTKCQNVLFIPFYSMTFSIFLAGFSPLVSKKKIQLSKFENQICFIKLFMNGAAFHPRLCAKWKAFMEKRVGQESHS